MSRISVDEMYGEWPVSEEQVAAALNRSLQPRSSDSLFDTLAPLGLGPDDAVLDIGCRDARHSLTLAERFGCRVVAVDPVDANVADGKRAIAASPLRDQVEPVAGVIEAIPAGDESFGLVFSRDMLSHIPDLATALRECHRVLRPGGWMVIYQTFATGRLEPAESARLYADLAVVPGSMDPEYLEDTASATGFEVVGLDVIGSEWREAWEEDGSHRTSQQLLHASRLLRARDALLAELGDVAYRVELANALWGVYQMIGKLEPRVYTLRKR